jgi:hypothetical protein
MRPLPGQYDVLILRNGGRGWESCRLPGCFAVQDVQRRFPGSIVAVRLPAGKTAYVREVDGYVRGPCDVVWDGMGNYALTYPDVTQMRGERLREAMRAVLMAGRS